MRCFLWPACWMAILTAAQSAQVEPGLPIWGEGERKQLESEGWVAGALLLTDDPIPEVPEKAAEAPLDVAQPTAEEIAETEAPSSDIPEKFLPAYFGERPAGFLADPQGLLGQVDAKNRLNFLNYHAGDSSIDLFVYLFKGDQSIPGEVREEELVERFYSEGRPAVVVFYYMGAPQKSVMYLSPSLTDVVSPAEQKRALESSVMQAFKDVDPAGQLESFLIQMSIRIYWMERMMGGGEVPVDEALLTVRPPKPQKTKPSILTKMQLLLEPAKPLVFPLAAGFGMIAVALVSSSILRRRARYRFPDFEVEPRLGGSHAAGIGAVISFASAAVPPASQRDQVPDYLRRA